MFECEVQIGGVGYWRAEDRECIDRVLAKQLTQVRVTYAVQASDVGQFFGRQSIAGI